MGAWTKVGNEYIATEVINGDFLTNVISSASNRLIVPESIQLDGIRFLTIKIEWETTETNIQSALIGVGSDGYRNSAYYWLSSGNTANIDADVKEIYVVFRKSGDQVVLPSAIGIVRATVEVEAYRWHIGQDGYPTNDLFPELPASHMEKPYPKALWRIDPQINGGYPFHELLPEVPLLGAFANAIDLKTVRIPETVKTIGRYAFRNTQLTSVTIASDCEYYDTSFPDDCIINFY